MFVTILSKLLITLRRHVPEYAIYYDCKYAEAAKHHHRRALILIARKLVRLVFALLHKHQTYHPLEAPTA